MFGSLGFKKKNMVRTPKKRAFFYWEKWAANEGSIYKGKKVLIESLFFSSWAILGQFGENQNWFLAISENRYLIFNGRFVISSKFWY